MPGSVVMVTREGTRPLLVEVQALVDDSSLGNPRRVVSGAGAKSSGDVIGGSQSPCWGGYL